MGGRLERQIQSIGQRLGENITQGLIDPFTHSGSQENPTFVMISDKISQIQIEHNPHIDKLVESAVLKHLKPFKTGQSETVATDFRRTRTKSWLNR